MDAAAAAAAAVVVVVCVPDVSFDDAVYEVVLHLLPRTLVS